MNHAKQDTTFADYDICHYESSNTGQDFQIMTYGIDAEYNLLWRKNVA